MDVSTMVGTKDADIPAPPSLNTQLANALADVAKKQDMLLVARSRVDDARREEISATNAVNEAQRHFDKLVAFAKKSAPRDTDWACKGAFKAEG